MSSICRSRTFTLIPWLWISRDVHDMSCPYDFNRSSHPPKYQPPETNMSLTTPLDPNELKTLVQKWGKTPFEQHTISVNHPFLTGKHQLITSDTRRAEICYVMHRGDPADGVLLHVKTYYPAGAYRLPTGGIHEGEAVEETLAREIYEETGMKVASSVDEDSGTSPRADRVIVQRYLGVIAYELDHQQQRQKHTFATYHFLVQMPENGTIVTLDPTEHIGGWAWYPTAQLGVVADRLDDVGDRDSQWADWGRFRALSHRFVMAQLIS